MTRDGRDVEFGLARTLALPLNSLAGRALRSNGSARSPSRRERQESSLRCLRPVRESRKTIRPGRLPARYRGETYARANAKSEHPVPRPFYLMPVTLCSSTPPRDAEPGPDRKRERTLHLRQIPPENSLPLFRNRLDASPARAIGRGGAENLWKRNSWAM